MEELSTEHIFACLAPLVHVFQQSLEGFLANFFVLGKCYEQGLFHLSWIAILTFCGDGGTTWNWSSHNHVQVLRCELPLFELFERFLNCIITDIVATVLKHFKDSASASI